MIDPNTLSGLVKERMLANQLVFEAGHKEGYRKGFADGVAEAKKIVDTTFGQLLKDKS